MKIKIWTESQNEFGEWEKSRELGTCVCDNAGRALSMYDDKCKPWENLNWEDITDEVENGKGKKSN